MEEFNWKKSIEPNVEFNKENFMEALLLLRQTLDCYEDNFIAHEVGIMIPETLQKNWDNIENFFSSITIKK